MSAWVGSPTW